MTSFIFAYTFGGPNLILSSSSANQTSYEATGSSGANETITLGIAVGNTFAGLGATEYQYNNTNALVSTSSGGVSPFQGTTNKAGEITTWQQQQGPSNNQVYSLGYDLAGQLTSAQSGTYGSASPSYNSEYFYSYDAGSNRVGADQYITRSITIGGTATAGDVLTLTVYDVGLSGGQEPVSYTVQLGDTLSSIAAGLNSAINADTNLQTIGVSSANFSGAVVTTFSYSVNANSYLPSYSSGATETMTVGANNSQNALTNATIVGTPTAGDVLTITVHDPGLSGGVESVSYTVQSGDSLADIAYNLSIAIHSDSNLSAISVSAYNNSDTVQIPSYSSNVTTFTQSINTGATEGIVFGTNTNVTRLAEIAGTPTAGDILTVTVYDAWLSGGSESVSYTVQSGDTLSSIASGLANAIESDPYLPSFMFAYTFGGPILTLSSGSANQTSYRATGSSGATETITLGIEVGNNYSVLGAAQYQYNNTNALVAITTGGVTPIQGTTNKAVTSGSVTTNTVNIQQAAPNQTTYSVPQYSSATETVSLAWAQNGNGFVFIGGTVTPGDVLPVIFYNPSLPSGQEQVSYTVLSGDTLNSILSGLAAAINADTNLAAIGITASAATPGVFTFQSTTTYSSSASSGATEGLYLNNNNNGNISGAIYGTPTPGDTITLTAYAAALPGGQESVTYTVQSGDTLMTIATGVAAAINADTNLAAAGITATNGAPAVLSWSQAFTASPILSGYSPTTMSATDAIPNTASSGEYDVFETGPPNWSYPSFDGNGNMTSDGTNSYLWDAENRLVEIDYPGTGNNSQFIYDGLGKCVSIVENAGGTVTSTRQFVWCGDDRCESRDASSAIISQFFSYGQTLSGSNYYYTKDHLGSVHELTDSSGNIQAQYSYDPYGRQTLLEGGLASDFQYAGYYYHALSGLNLTLNRAYSSAFGRFISRDPIMESDSVNLYTYAENQPTCQTDPLGLWPMGAPYKDKVEEQLPGKLKQLCPGLSDKDAKDLAKGIVDRLGWGDIGMGTKLKNLKSFDELTDSQQTALRNFLSKLPQTPALQKLLSCLPKQCPK